MAKLEKIENSVAEFKLDVTPEKFEEGQKHDSIKFSYCQEHSIPLYYITYLENIEERLKEIINELYC